MKCLSKRLGCEVVVNVLYLVLGVLLVFLGLHNWDSSDESISVH